MTITVIVGLLLYFVGLCSSFIGDEKNSKQPIIIPKLKDADNIFPSQYDVLAPFPAGTREFGADPLEAFGGIRNIPRADNSVYPSELYYQARVGWSKFPTDANGMVSISWNNATLVNWDLLAGWAGSVGVSLQGWAIGDVVIPTTGLYLAYCGPNRLFYIDNTLLTGDSYAAGMISTPISLNQGNHTFYVPFSAYQSTSWSCVLSPVDTSLSLLFRSAGDDLNVIPDIISYNGTISLTSPYISLAYTNLNSISYLQQVTVSVSPTSPIVITSQYSPNIAPGQTLPINFQISTRSTVTSCSSAQVTVNFSVTFQGAPAPVVTSINFTCINWPIWTNSYKFTFPDVDGSIQYAMARPPNKTCTNFPNGCSVLMSLHGAGVISSPFWASFYQQQDYAWLVLPTNRRFYGFDWQGPGLHNAWSAFNYLTQNLPGIPAALAPLYLADSYRILYAGHSMGGHGCWLISTHYPDRAIAVAPAAGWINFPLYVPYFSRLGLSLVPPFLEYILNAAITEDTPDLLATHLVGVPLITRFGSLDDNVPPYHMRRMIRLINSLSGNATITEVSEDPTQGHWWDDVCDGPPMQDFFARNAIKSLPPLPSQFTVATANPATSESKGGIRILQLTIPFRMAYISVQQSSDGRTWNLTLENVRRFGFISIPNLIRPTTIVIGSLQFSVQSLPVHFYNSPTGWNIVSDNSWRSTERHPETYGPFWQIIQGPLLLVYGTAGTDLETSTRYNYAQYLANTLFYRGRYAPTVCSDSQLPPNYQDFNLVLIGGPTTNRVTAKYIPMSPVQFQNRAPIIQNTIFNTPATGIAYIGPGYSSDRLVGVLAGTDEKGLYKALMLFPTSSGVTMPDYAVAGPNWGWAGSAGLLAAGFWNNAWTYSSDSGYIAATTHF